MGVWELNSIGGDNAVSLVGTSTVSVVDRGDLQLPSRQLKELQGATVGQHPGSLESSDSAQPFSDWRMLGAQGIISILPSLPH